jgi:hypothetical protein
MTFDQRIQIWVALGTWFSGVGTIAAVAVALYLANRRPRLRFDVMTQRVLSNDPTRKFIQIEVTNCGDRSTTLTNIALAYFEKRWSWARLRNRPMRAAVLINPNIPGSSVSQPLPCELKAGGVWRGLTAQESQLEMWARNGVLYFDLYHSHNVKPIRKRVTLQPDYRVAPVPVRL